jgi:hypothetical protein
MRPNFLILVASIGFLSLNSISASAQEAECLNKFWAIWETDSQGSLAAIFSPTRTSGLSAATGALHRPIVRRCGRIRRLP